MSPNQQETADLVTLTEEILHGKFHGNILCSAFITVSGTYYVVFLNIRRLQIQIN